MFLCIIDRNFTNLYNQIGSKRLFISPQKNSLVMDSYYREKLGIEETAKDYDLTIKRVGKYAIFNNLRYLREHPNNSIRIAYWLAVVAIIISIIIPLGEWVHHCVNKFLHPICK